MKIMLLLLSFLMTNIALSREVKFECASNTEEYSALAKKYEDRFEKELKIPQGLYLFHDEFLGDANLNFYVDEQEKFGMFTGSETYSRNVSFDICTYEDRTFILDKEQEDYIEFYFDNKILMLADQGIDVENPEDRSEFKFLKVRPAKVVVIEEE